MKRFDSTIREMPETMRGETQTVAVAHALDVALDRFNAGNLAEAEQICRQILAVEPDNADALHLLGLLAHQSGRNDIALELVLRATAIQPLDAEYLNTFGEILRALGRYAEAGQYYRRAIALNPGYATAYGNLAIVLQSFGKPEESARSCRRALTIDPALAHAHNTLGGALSDLGRLDDAKENLHQALALIPDFTQAHNNLGNLLKSLGRLEEAERSYRQALALKPGYAIAHMNLIMALDLIERCGVREQQEERRRWYAMHGSNFAGSIRPHGNRPDPERRLRIGYVSADFRWHSAYFVSSPVILRHNPFACEVVCYSGAVNEDDATARVKRAASLWRPIHGATDDALAEQIRRDEIDILVDLSGHSAGNRLPVFARKPAPVQITAWGYATGTGLATMDYFFADPVLVPQEERKHFAEEIVDLPCFVCYEAPAYAPEVSPLPSLQSRPFTFACINRVEKISDRVIALWGRILAVVPHARLLIKDQRLDSAGARARLVQRLDRCGVPREAVRLLGTSSHREHLRVYHEVDLALDPFPHGGGVSTAEALWMGVPVVTLVGATVTSRLSASILSALGMQEWVAQNDDEYVRIAVSAAADLHRLAQLRLELRSRMAASPVGDAEAYTRRVEQTYRELWRRWCGRPRWSG